MARILGAAERGACARLRSMTLDTLCGGGAGEQAEGSGCGIESLVLGVCQLAEGQEA